MRGVTLHPKRCNLQQPFVALFTLGERLRFQFGRRLRKTEQKEVRQGVNESKLGLLGCAQPRLVARNGTYSLDELCGFVRLHPVAVQLVFDRSSNERGGGRVPALTRLPNDFLEEWLR